MSIPPLFNPIFITDCLPIDSKRLIEIGKIIKGPPPYDAHCSQFNKFHQSCKLISLGSTCKAIRIALASLLFCCIEIGFRDEAKFSIKPQLDRMMESPYILKHVR